MGWGSGIDENGRKAGYNVEAMCEEQGCTAQIDRGLSYKCGGIKRLNSGEDKDGCGKYFCGEHLSCLEGGLCPNCNKTIDLPDEEESDDA